MIDKRERLFINKNIFDGDKWSDDSAVTKIVNGCIERTELESWIDPFVLTTSIE